MKSWLRLFAATFVLGTLISCGGGSGEDSDTPTTPPVTPPPPSASPPLPEEASHFLHQATFGPTLDSINEVVNAGFEAWIDQQVALPISTHSSYFSEVHIADDDTWSQHTSAWFKRSITAEDQLRQRVAFALSEILVVSSLGVSDGGLDGSRSLSNYYDILLRHAFGNYRTLLNDVTLSPVMGEYLSMLRNEKPNESKNIRPDENYARELMQLFSIGLVELELDGSVKTNSNGNPIPTYSQEDIVGLAHVFTGWTWGNAPQFRWWSEDRDLFGPMKAFADYHDSNEKVIIGGVVIPANQTPEQDLKDALDAIFAHDNVAPFVSFRLIQRLTTSNPSREYIERVATVFENNGSGVRGDLAAVVKAILLDGEARNGERADGKSFGKIKEPLLRLTNVWRAFDAYSQDGTYDFRWVGDDLSQAPLKSPSVFNFFSPSYSPSGNLKEQGVLSPEMQIHTEGTMAKMTNQLHWRTLDHNNLVKTSPDSDDILLHINRERDLAANIPDLIEHLDLLMLAGTMSDHTNTVLTEYLETFDSTESARRAYEAIGMIATSPEFAVQR